MIYQNVLVQLLQKQIYPLMWNRHCLWVNQCLWILWVTIHSHKQVTEIWNDMKCLMNQTSSTKKMSPRTSKILISTSIDPHENKWFQRTWEITHRFWDRYWGEVEGFDAGRRHITGCVRGAVLWGRFGPVLPQRLGVGGRRVWGCGAL